MNKHLYIKEEDIHEASAYSTNITINPHLEMSNKQINHKHVPDSDAITIDISPDILKFKLRNSSTKDFDSMSMASSTHFTVVNGIGRPPKVPKSSLCDRGHQITVLIVTMSMFFMIGISLAVYFMESKCLSLFAFLILTRVYYTKLFVLYFQCVHVKCLISGVLVKPMPFI